jgi:type I restriction enzyme M protein
VVTTVEKRAEMAKKTERFKKFPVDKIRKRDYNLDIFWLKDDSLEDAEDMPEPEELAGGAITHLEAAINGLQEIMVQLGDGNNDMGPQITQD